MTIERRILFTTTVLLLLTAAVITFVTIPSFKGIAALAKNITEQQSAIEQRYVLRDYAKRIISETTTASKDLDLIRQTYLIENKELNFVQDMERAATLTGVEQNISLEIINEIEINQWEKKIPIKIRVSGQFPQVMGWLNEIEHLKYFVIIDSIAINTKRKGSSTETGKVEAYLTGHVYWLSESAPYFSTTWNKTEAN